MPLRLPRDLLDGPAPAWPRPLDALFDRWAGLPARGRAAVRAAAAVVVLLAATGGLVEGPWGPSVPVLVVTEEVAAGARVPADAVAIADRPRDLVPADAVHAPADLPPDAVADGRLPVGAVLTSGALSAGGPAAAARPGTAVVPVPGELLPHLPVGTRLDLAVAGPDGSTTTVAQDAVLVGNDGTWHWLRVERTAVPALARGISVGSLVAGVLPAGPGDGP